MKKRIVAGVLALVMVLGLAGCGDQAIGGSDTTTVSNEYEEVVIDGITYKKALDMTSDKITLTFGDETNTHDFASGEENGQKYIRIGLFTYNKVDK